MKYKNLSLSAYAFGYGCGFINDQRDLARNKQNVTLDKLIEIANNFNLGGLEIPIDKYFKNSNINDLEIYINKMKDHELRMIYALENFEHNYFSLIAPLIRKYNGNFIRVKISNFYGGNRFKEEKYNKDIIHFRDELNKSINIIDEFGIKVLIENHQDITLDDIFNLIEDFGSNRIGVNWDTGNSFPTGETVETFLNKTINYVENVHLKDYRVQSSPDGYIMHRCTLGKGIVDFEFLINKLIEKNSNIPFTIELGAMNGREAMINNELYWKYTKGISLDERKHLVDFINSKVENNKIISSLWERNSTPDEIIISEYDEVVESINYISNILNKL